MGEKYEVDLDVKDQFAPLPEGDYTCVVESIDVRNGPQSKYWNVVLLIADGQHKGLHIYDNISMAEKAAWKFRDFVRAIGVLGTTGKVSVDPDDIVNTPVIATCESEEYNGRSRVRPVRYKRHESVQAYLDKENATAPVAASTSTVSTAATVTATATAPATPDSAKKKPTFTI